VKRESGITVSTNLALGLQVTFLFFCYFVQVAGMDLNPLPVVGAMAIFWIALVSLWARLSVAARNWALIASTLFVFVVGMTMYAVAFHSLDQVKPVFLRINHELLTAPEGSGSQ
jgi:hypothetical protein